LIFSEPDENNSSSMEKDTSRNQERNSQPMDDIYKQLAKHLDDLPGGFPSTESGVELRILRRLFTLEEAALALSLTLLPEEPAHAVRRIHLPEEETARRVEKVAK